MFFLLFLGGVCVCNVNVDMVVLDTRAMYYGLRVVSWKIYQIIFMYFVSSSGLFFRAVVTKPPTLILY